MKGGEKKVFGKQSNGEASEDFFNSIYRIFAGGTRQICWNSNLFFTFVSRLFVQQEGKVLLPTRESVWKLKKFALWSFYEYVSERVESDAM